MSLASRQVWKQILIAFALAAIATGFIGIGFARPAHASAEFGCDVRCGLQLQQRAVPAKSASAHRQHAHRARGAAHWHNGRAVRDANGNRAGVIRSGKTGAVAHVDPHFQSRFQALLDDFEDHGATVYYMGGWRPGHCSLASQHPCSWAVDFCQDSRGRVSGDRDCHLPPPKEFHALVRAHGLYDGSVWCNGDYGHVQVKDSGGCGIAAHGWARGHYYASMTGKVEQASARTRVHHERRRYAHHHRHRRIADL